MIQNRKKGRIKRKKYFIQEITIITVKLMTINYT